MAEYQYIYIINDINSKTVKISRIQEPYLEKIFFNTGGIVDGLYWIWPSDKLLDLVKQISICSRRYYILDSLDQLPAIYIEKFKTNRYYFIKFPIPANLLYELDDIYNLSYESQEIVQQFPLPARRNVFKLTRSKKHVKFRRVFFDDICNICNKYQYKLLFK